MNGPIPVSYVRGRKGLQDFVKWICSLNANSITLASYNRHDFKLLLSACGKLKIRLPTVIQYYADVLRAIKGSYQIENYCLQRTYKYFVSEKNRKITNLTAKGTVAKTILITKEAADAQSLDDFLDGYCAILE
jgi:hypothetical protein